MFKNATRKKLLQHKWLEGFEDDKNPSLSRSRIKEGAKRGIRDLTLLAKVVPQNDLDDVFSEENVNDLLNAIFFSNQRSFNNTFYSNAELASILVSIGVSVCVSKYSADNSEYPNTAQPVIDYLNKTIDICYEIGNKAKLERIEKETNLKLICILEDIGHKDSEKFDSYLTKEFNLPMVFDKTIKNGNPNSLKKQIVITINPITKGDEDFEYIGIVTLDLDFINGVCNVLYSPSHGGGNKTIDS